MQRLRNLINAWRERYRDRRSLQPLMEASDRDLEDLGLRRQDLMYLRAGHRIERPPGGDGTACCRPSATSSSIQ